MRKWAFLLSLSHMLLLSTACIANEHYKQFSSVRPWAVMKRGNGTCFAVAQAFEGDAFVLFSRPDGVYVSLGNSKFQIAAGGYPAQVSLKGSTIVPGDVRSTTGVVEEGRPNWIVLKLQDHQIKNLPKASLLVISLGSKDHLLFLDDTLSMMRDLDLCAKHKSDPLKSAR